MNERVPRSWNFVSNYSRIHCCFCVNKFSAINIVWSFTFGHMLLGMFLTFWLPDYGGKGYLEGSYFGLRLIFYILFNVFHCRYMVPVKFETYETRKNATYAFAVIILESICCIALIISLYMTVEKQLERDFIIFICSYHGFILLTYVHFTRVSITWANRIKTGDIRLTDNSSL